jgi:hypothetical protein
MARRTLLVALLVASTAAFVVGVSIERSSADTHTSEGGAEHAEDAGADDGHAEAGQSGSDEGSSESFFGVDYEATPFVALAATFSLALAVAVWLRPRWALVLGTVALAMVLFGALDVREVIHQLDESKGGLALLAGFVALCHLAAAAVAAFMDGLDLTHRDARPGPEPG